MRRDRQFFDSGIFSFRHLDCPPGERGLLDRSLPRWVCGLLVLAILSVPLLYVKRHDDPKQDLTSLICFGQFFVKRQLPELRALHPFIQSPSGYDAQFYAQIALDPAMQRLDLRTACDHLEFRGQRWLPSALAWAIGLGQPRWILFAYVLLNPLSWVGLIVLLVLYFRGRTARQYFCLTAAALSTGALICMERSLGDLPGTTLVVYAAVIDGASAAVLISMAGLCKPTFVLAASRYVFPLPVGRQAWLKRSGLLVLALAGPVLLHFYLLEILGSVMGPGKNLDWPFVGLFGWIGERWVDLRSAPFDFKWRADMQWEWNLFEFLAPICLLIQTSHLAIWRQFRSPIWWMGASFGVLFLCLSRLGLLEHIASTRTVLPLTIAFNLRLAAQRGPVFWAYFIAGNCGLVWCWHDMYCWCATHP